VRSVAGVRQHTTDIINRGVRVSCQFPRMKESGKQLADRAKCHSGNAFFGCDDALKPGGLSTLPEIRKRQSGG